MTEITITNNRASRAIVALQPVPAARDLHNLQISSQWTGVKNPEALHSMVSLCPDTDDLRALHAWLGTYLQINADSPAASVQDSDHEFKNFHRLLCERFGYTHDEVDWKRDQISLIEWIAKQVKPAAPVQEPKQSPPFTFRRFVAGSERAQDVAVHREITLDAAIRVAAKICPPSESGHPTVLVYTPPPPPPPPAQPAAPRALEVARLPADDTEGGAA